MSTADDRRAAAAASAPRTNASIHGARVSERIVADVAADDLTKARAT